MRLGDTFLKVDADDGRLQREIEAMALAIDIPTPAVRWKQPHVLALAAVRGEQLGRLGEPSNASPDAWAAAGAAARRLHSLPLPPWGGWTVDEFALRIDHDCRWLVDHGVTPFDVVERVRAQAQIALRPFPLVFTHGDFQAAHVLVEGDSVDGIIDWPDCVQGDALWDLAVLTVGHGDRLGHVVRGYGGDVDQDVVRGWWAVRRLLSVRWMLQHGFDAAGDIAALHLSYS